MTFKLLRLPTTLSSYIDKSLDIFGSGKTKKISIAFLVLTLTIILVDLYYHVFISFPFFNSSPNEFESLKFTSDRNTIITVDSIVLTLLGLQILLLIGGNSKASNPALTMFVLMISLFLNIIRLTYISQNPNDILYEDPRRVVSMALSGVEIASLSIVGFIVLLYIVGISFIPPDTLFVVEFFNFQTVYQEV
jgi:hypothetical protein